MPAEIASRGAILGAMRHSLSIGLLAILGLAACAKDKGIAAQTSAQALAIVCDTSLPSQLAPRLDPVHDESRHGEMLHRELYDRVTNAEISQWLGEMFNVEPDQRARAMQPMLTRYGIAECPIMLQ